MKNLTSFVTSLVIAAAAVAATACTDPGSGGDAVTLTFKDGSVTARAGAGDRAIAVITDPAGAAQATLTWDGATAEGVLDVPASARSEHITAGDAVDALGPLSLTQIAELAYHSWRADTDAKLHYGDCYYIGGSSGVECCWGNRGWNCVVY